MIYFIINPNASSGLGEKTWEELKKILDNRKIEYDFALTTREKRADFLADEISKNLVKPITIGIIGGDGTINEVINGLKNFDLVTLGVIPIGSGNDFVRSYGYKTSLQNYLEIILSPKKILNYNIGKTKNSFSERKFIVSSGIGFDAQITYTVNNSKFRKIFKNTPISKLVYIFSTLKVIFQFKPVAFTVIEEGKTNIFNSPFFSVIMNTPYEGKGVKFCPDAKGYDDIFDFCIINTRNKFKLAFLTLRAFSGKHVKSKDVYISKGKYFKIETSKELHCHTDGEQVGKSNWAEFVLLKDKIKVIVE